MMHSRRIKQTWRIPELVFVGLLLLFVTGCTVNDPSLAAGSELNGAADEPVEDKTAYPDVNMPEELPAETDTPVPPAPSTPSPFPPTLTSSPLPTDISPTPCSAEVCRYLNTFIFSPPIASPGNHSVDTTYRFGSTQNGKRDPHHGIELLNSAGTPVIAAGDGLVVVAGDDREILHSPYPNYYGNLVVLEHVMPDDFSRSVLGMPGSVYTLYAHLSEVKVAEGERVQVGEEIGLVGMSGAATGSHLHFEIRLGENSYASVRNPELWLLPGLEDDGQVRGAIAGVIMDADGNIPEIENIVLTHLPDGPDGAKGREFYINTYEEDYLTGTPPWEESFGAGNLPPGWYRISFPYYGLQRQLLQVFPGELTVVRIVVGE